MPYDDKRIYSAVKRACYSVQDLKVRGNEDKIAMIITERVGSHFHEAKKAIPIKAIQSAVETELMRREYLSIATSYIEYRSARERERMFGDSADVEKMVARLMSKDATIVNENANKDSRTFATNRDLTAGTVAKATGIKLLPPEVAKAHIKGEVHQHDLDFFPYSPMTNCQNYAYGEMLRKGFSIGNAELATPKSIRVAVAHLVQMLSAVGGSAYGGSTFNRIDEELAVYASKNYEKHYNQLSNLLEPIEPHELKRIEQEAITLTERDIYEAMQALEFEINTLTTVQGQVPFVTVNFGLGTGRWERAIQKAILEVRLQGLGGGKTAIFPKLVMGIKRGINANPEDPNYDIKQLALECASRRIYPDILNYDKLVEVTGSYKSPMGCRSFLQAWKDAEGNEVNEGRGNLGVSTINMPRIALESRGNKEKFWELLEVRMDIVAQAMRFRISEVFGKAKPEMAPIMYKAGLLGHNLEDGESVAPVFNNLRGTISMGYIGLYEVGAVFYGGAWENNPEAKEFTLDILKRMKAKCLELSDELGVWASVYATPSESLTDKLARLDLETFGEVENVTDKGYYTNSFHVDVRKQLNPFAKIDFEKDYIPHTSGGFITYVEAPVMKWNLKSLEALWDYSYDQVPYFGVNIPIDKCFECGFEGDFEPTEKGYQCPECGNSNSETTDVIKRQCGYLGQPQLRPNVKGRKKEIDSRVKHFDIKK